MSKMDSFFNLSPLNTIVSTKVISFSDISAVNLMIGGNLLACSIKSSTSLSLSQKEKISSIYRLHLLGLFRYVVSDAHSAFCYRVALRHPRRPRGS